MAARSFPWAIFSALALCATGCATTGLAWVHERESGVDLTPPEPPSESARRPAGPSSPAESPAARVDLPPPSDAMAVPAERPRHRLDRTITLGGTAESSARPYAAAAPTADPRAPTIVNVYVNQPSPGMAYGGSYGYAYGYASPVFLAPRASVVGTQAPAALRPGLDWPAVPNHGPAFPYRTGPASPWDGAGPRRR